MNECRKIHFYDSYLFILTYNASREANERTFAEAAQVEEEQARSRIRRLKLDSST